MGHILDIGVDVAYSHEGYAAWVLDDGTLTGTASTKIDPRKTGKLRAACSCGWSDPEFWDVDSDDPADWPSEALEEDILAAWEVHVRGLVDSELIEQTTTLLRVLRGFSANADDLEGAALGTEARAEVLERIRGNLTYAAELIDRMTTEEN